METVALWRVKQAFAYVEREFGVVFLETIVGVKLGDRRVLGLREMTKFRKIQKRASLAKTSLHCSPKKLPGRSPEDSWEPEVPMAGIFALRSSVLL